MSFKLNNHLVLDLALEKGWSQNELARQMQIPRGTLSNVLSGRRGAGRKVIVGLLKAFPEEKLENLILSKNIKTTREVK